MQALAKSFLDFLSFLLHFLLILGFQKCKFTLNCYNKVYSQLVIIGSIYEKSGEVQEWLNWHAWKVCRRATVSRVRIPLSPPGEERSGFILAVFLFVRKRIQTLASGSPRQLAGHPSLLKSPLLQICLCLHLRYSVIK